MQHAVKPSVLRIAAEGQCVSQERLTEDDRDSFEDVCQIKQ